MPQVSNPNQGTKRKIDSISDVANQEDNVNNSNKKQRQNEPLAFQPVSADKNKDSDQINHNSTYQYGS
jgi:hypothetical protein